MQEDKVRRRFLFIAGPVTLFLILVGFTYAFFNYTRTGAANTISTGRINFLTTQSNTLSLTNVFPLASSELTNANLDEVELRIQGDTTYTGGEEFEITIVGVNNTIGTSPNEKTIPINFIARYVPTASGENIGTPAVSDYYSERGSTTAVYELTETGVAENGKQVLVGYIPRNGEIDGTLKISAYLDASNIAISDTYYENAPTPTPTGPNDEYGTTTEWVNGRTVLTTEEWNDLQNSQEPLSFKIKAVSQEGTWVTEPIPTIPSCLDCKFTYFVATGPEDAKWTTWNTQSQTPTQITTGLYNNYEELIATTGKNYFLGVKLNSNNEVTNAYACGVKDNVPFCIEGYSDNSKYNANKTLLNGANLYNNTCIETVEDEGTENEYRYSACGPWNNSGSLSAYADSDGYVRAGVGSDGYCAVTPLGDFECGESGADEPDPSEPGGGGVLPGN